MLKNFLFTYDDEVYGLPKHIQADSDRKALQKASVNGFKSIKEFLLIISGSTIAEVKELLIFFFNNNNNNNNLK